MTKTILFKSILCGLLLIPFVSLGQWNMISNENILIRYYDVSLTSDSTVFICGRKDTSGIILRSHDMGITWDTASFAGECFNISFPTPSIGYVLVYPWFVYKTINGGNSWNLIADSIYFYLPSHDLLFINKDTGYISAQDGGAVFYRTIDGGITWNQIIDSTYQNIGGREIIYNNGNLYLTIGSYFLKSSDFGDHWQASINDSINGTFSTISVYNDTVWLAGIGCGGTPHYNYGIVARYINGGLSWSNIENQHIDQYRDLRMINNHKGYLVGGVWDSSYNFLKTIDGGNSWCYQQWIGNNQYGFYLNAIDCINDSICFAVGYNGTIFKTINGGGQLIDLSVAKIVDETSLIIFPNPMTNFAIMEFNYKEDEKYILNIYDVIGQRIKEINNISTGQIRIERNDYKSGFYLFELKDEDRIIGTKKLIIE